MKYNKLTRNTVRRWVIACLVVAGAVCSACSSPAEPQHVDEIVIEYRTVGGGTDTAHARASLDTLYVTGRVVVPCSPYALTATQTRRGGAVEIQIEAAQAGDSCRAVLETLGYEARSVLPPGRYRVQVAHTVLGPDATDVLRSDVVFSGDVSSVSPQ